MGANRSDIQPYLRKASSLLVGSDDEDGCKTDTTIKEEQCKQTGTEMKAMR